MTPLFHFAVRSGEEPVTHSSFIICKQFINRLKESSEKQQSTGKVDLSNMHRHLTSYSNLNSPSDATKTQEKCRPSKQVKVESSYRKSGCVKQLLKSDKSKQEKISQCLAWAIDLVDNPPPPGDSQRTWDAHQMSCSRLLRYRQGDGRRRAPSPLYSWSNVSTSRVHL